MGSEQLVAAILRRFFPPPPYPPGMEPLTAAERRTFHRWEVGLTLGTFPIIGAMAVAWYFALRNLGTWCYPTPPGTARLIGGSPILWALPAFFLGVISAAGPQDTLARLLLGDRYPRYMRAGEERSGFDGWRSMRALAVLVFVGATIFFFAAIRLFVRFDAGGMELGRPFRFGTTYYPDRDIRAVEHRASLVAPIGNVVHRSHYVVCLADGAEWEVDEIYDLPPGGARGLAEYIARRAGREVVERP